MNCVDGPEKRSLFRSTQIASGDPLGIAVLYFPHYLYRKNGLLGTNISQNNHELPRVCKTRAALLLLELFLFLAIIKVIGFILEGNVFFLGAKIKKFNNQQYTENILYNLPRLELRDCRGSLGGGLGAVSEKKGNERYMKSEKVRNNFKPKMGEIPC